MAARPDLIAVRPLIEAGADRIVGSPGFLALVRGGVYDLHRSAFDRHSNSLTLRVADAGVLVASALEAFAPKVAARIPPAAEATIARVSRGDFGKVADVATTVDRVHSLGIWLLAGALCALLLAVAVAVDRLRAVARVGAAIAAAGLATVLLYTVARPLVLTRVAGGDARTAAAALWDAFLGDLRLSAAIVAALGGAIAAGAAALGGTDAQTLWSRARGFIVTTPRGAPGLARGATLLALGAAVVFAGSTVLRVAFLIAGAALIYAGARELMRVALALRMPALPALRIGRLLVVGLVLVALVAAVGLAGRTQTAPAITLAGGRCNGYRALCNRPVNRVAFPATHNSMADSTSAGWLFPSQDGDIRAQLKAGVRGLLIDTHYGFPTPRGVATELTAETRQRAKFVDAVGANFIDTVDRLRARIGYRGGGHRAVYLCHAFCEVGATPVLRALGEIRDFVVQHPGEVLIISVQDDVSPADTRAAFRASGLLDLVYQGRSGPPWPTLGDLIAQNRRVIVFAENDSGGIPWYRPQFRQVEETPYQFRSVAKLTAPASCRPHRGGSGKSLFLLNHWVETAPAPRPTNADRVNAYSALLGRARRCQAERHRLPNLVAVDFYGRGDLFKVTRTLNAVK